MAFAFSTTPTAGAGTINIARNSTTVTGVGTNFQSPSLVGQIILVNGFNSRVTAVASATSMTIVSAPTYEITGETFSFVTGATNINQTGADTDPSGLSALLGVNTTRVGIQAVYDLGCLRLATTGAAATFSYDANFHCIVWSNQVIQPEFTNGTGRTTTITGARTDGTYTAPFYPRAMAMPRVLPGDSSFLPDRRAVANSGTLNLSGVWFDTNQVQQMTGTVNITEIKWSSTNQGANFRLNSSGVTINGMDLYNMPLTVIAAPAALNGMKFYKSDYTPVSLPAVSPTNPRIYTNWNFQGSLPFMNNFSGNANYVEFRNFGDWAGFRLATNSAVNMAARFVKNVSVNVINTLGVGITNAIVYRLDTNNGSRVTYTADEHFIETTASGTATGRILALIGRLPTGAANNSTQYTAFMDCRNATNDQTGNDVLRYVSYSHLLGNRPVNLKGNNTLISEQTLFDDPSVTLSRTNAIAKLASSFTVDPVTKIVTVTANSSFDDLYDALKAYKATANAVNLATPTLDSLIVTPNGTSLEAFTGWNLVVNTGVTLSSGAKFNTVEFDTVTINGTGQITGVYQTSAGTSTVLELRVPSDGYSLCVFRADGTTKYFQSNVTIGTYYVYFTPAEAGTYYLGAEKYGQKRTADTLVLSGGNVWYNITDQEDVGITDNFATASAYTTLSTTSQIYDATAIFRLSETGIKLGQLVARDGLYLDFTTYNVKIKDDASAIVAVASGTITYKSIVINESTKYNAMKATPPKTITPTDTEIINVLIEDANGDSQIEILGGASPFSIYKFNINTTDFPVGTIPDTRTDVSNFVESISERTYRFLFDADYNYFVYSPSIRSDANIPNVGDGQTEWEVITKGKYTAPLYKGNEIQLASDAPQLLATIDKLDELTLKVDTNLDAKVSTRATPQNVLDAKTEVLEAISEIPTTDISGLALEATSQDIKTKVLTLENYNDATTQTKLDALQTDVTDAKTEILEAITEIPETDISLLALESTSQSIKTKTDTLENYDDTTLISKVDEIQTSVNDIDVDFTPVLEAVDLTLKADDYIAPDNSKIAEIKTKVDSLQNYNDATAQAKLDEIKAKTDVLVNTDLTGIATATDVENAKTEILTAVNDIEIDNEAIANEVWNQEPERLKQVATVETTGEQIASFNTL
jgi:hypothetical protein